MILIMTIATASSLILMVSTHPIAILSMVLIQTMNICIMSWITIKTSWFSYILFLIFLGGLMILFVYITSMASNEKFEMNFNETLALNKKMFLIVSLVITLLTFNKNYSTNNAPLTQHNMMIFSNSLIMPSILMMTYLLMTLIVAVKIVNMYEGPLRSVIKK
uniref:NADH-ubiquinone oxidoreductase chain 6 n=1 Tax=Dicranocentrus wangi TaxID=1302322 RepID=A0A6H0EVS9_9HEXA|nr:NADH dehydrogenase subunit 6 [Dicranocentrus wangi]QIT06442.1 NADH dehydrogenase subunit 6 [Dicranocentrus wangi]